MKRIVSIFMAFALMFTSLSSVSFAQEVSASEVVTASVSDGNGTVSGGNGTVSDNYVNYDVTFDFGNEEVEKLTLTVSAGSLLADVVKGVEEPKQGDYIFLGWLLNGEPIANDYKVESDLELSPSMLYVGELASDEFNQQFKDILTGIGGMQEQVWVAGLSDVTYTGKKITHNLKVYDGTRLLQAKKDYTISYKNNQKVYELGETEEGFNKSKAPQVIIKMKGNYKGKQTLYFEINKADISVSANMVEVEDFFVAGKAGKVMKPAVKVLFNGKKLGSKDFEVAEYKILKDKTNAKYAETEAALKVEEAKFKTVTLHLTGKGSFEGTREVELTIGDTKLDISKMKIDWKKKIPFANFKNAAVSENTVSDNTVSDNTVSANSTLQLKVTSKTGNKEVLVEGKDYTVTIENADGVGTAYATITATKGEGATYFGSKTIKFSLTGNAMKNVKLDSDTARWLSQTKFTYDYGNEIRPLDDKDFTLLYKGDKVSGNICEVKYDKNWNKGKATIRLVGNPKEGFTGTKKYTFNIAPMTISANDVTLGKADMMKGGVKPVVTVTSNGNTLIEGKDYTVAYSKNKKFGTKGKVTVKAKGNFKNTVTKEFNIEEKSISGNGIKVIVKDKEVDTNKGKWLQPVKVVDKDGKALKAGKDYTLSYKQFVVSGNDIVSENDLNPSKNKDVKVESTIVVTVTAKENSGYKGTVEASYRLLAKGYDISKATFVINPVEFDGKYGYVDLDDFKTAQIGRGNSAVKLITEEDGKKVAKFVIASYENNNKKGKAKVTLRGNEELGFGGEKVVTFKIVEKGIEGENSNWFSALVNALLGLFRR